MQFISDIAIAIVTTFLIITNSLAASLVSFFPTTIEYEPASEVETIPSLPSRISTAIPDILLRSALYQQAAVIESAGYTGGNTTNPIEAIVNIFCTFTTDEYIRTTTGTGFFIDADGIIMTNAHVAQFLLMATTEQFGEAECIVRGGNPATPQYYADLLYIPPAWVQANASVMHDAVPMGTGERDYALLYVTSTINSEPLPAQFPALNFDSELLPVSSRNTVVIAAGYPAADLVVNGPSTDLLPRSATTSISELYTFGSNYADVISIRGSVVGAEGASGGPVLNDEGDVIGIIVTRGDDTLDGAGSLRAITLSHVHRTILEETGFTLEENLDGNLAYRAQIFSETLSPFLIQILSLGAPTE